MLSIVFVPGFTCTAALYGPQLLGLSGRYQCSVGDHTRSNTMKGIAQDILNAAPERFALVGLSMGGYIAFEIMRQAPERVVKLALLDTQARPESDEQRINRAARVEAARTGGMDALSDLQWPSFVHPARYEDEPLRGLVRQMARDTGFEVFLRQATAISNRPDSRVSMSAIKAPTLVLVGAQDALTPPDRSQEIAAAVPDARLTIVPDCGHLSTLEKPAAVNAALVEFLG